MNMRRETVAALAAALQGSAALAQQSWNCNAEFSPVENPSGTWTCGYTVGGRTGPFTALNQAINVNGATFWTVSGALPWIGKNSTPAPVPIADNPVLPAGVMMMHPGVGSGGEWEAALRWTSPVSGLVLVDAHFGGVPIDPNETSVDVSVIKDGAQLFAMELAGLGAGVHYRSVVAVAAGDAVDFHVGIGGNGTIYNDSTAISVVISTCPADLGATGGVAGPDGVLDNNDFVIFIELFFAHDPRADFGRVGGQPGADGAFDNNDFVVYIDAFFAGC